MSSSNSSRLSGRMYRAILFLSILAATSSSLKAQTAAQTDSTETKERTEVGSALAKFKDNMSGLFNKVKTTMDSTQVKKDNALPSVGSINPFNRNWADSESPLSDEEETVKFSNFIILASSEQNIHISEVNGTVASPMMVGARYTTGNRKKAYENDKLPDNQVELTAKMAMGATYSQDGSFTAQSYTPVVRNQSVGLVQLQGAYLTGANSFYARYSHLSNTQGGQNMAIKEGGNGFITLGYNANLLNAVTRKGNQYSVNTGIEHTRTASVDATTNVTANIHSTVNHDKGPLKYLKGTTVDIGAKVYTDGAGQFNLTVGIPLGKKNRKVIEYNEHARVLIDSTQKKVLAIPGRKAYFNRGLR